jgi:hypothetical protein
MALFRSQVAFVYYEAGVYKTMVKEWADGTALYKRWLKSFSTAVAWKRSLDGIHDFPDLKTYKSSATNCFAS